MDIGRLVSQVVTWSNSCIQCFYPHSYLSISSYPSFFNAHRQRSSSRGQAQAYRRLADRYAGTFPARQDARAPLLDRESENVLEQVGRSIGVGSQ